MLELTSSQASLDSTPPCPARQVKAVYPSPPCRRVQVPVHAGCWGRSVPSPFQHPRYCAACSPPPTAPLPTNIDPSPVHTSCRCQDHCPWLQQEVPNIAATPFCKGTFSLSSLGLWCYRDRDRISLAFTVLIFQYLSLVVDTHIRCYLNLRLKLTNDCDITRNNYNHMMKNLLHVHTPWDMFIYIVCEIMELKIRGQKEPFPSENCGKY